MKLTQKSWIFASALALVWGLAAGVQAQEVPPNQQEQGVPPHQQEQGVPPGQQEQEMSPNQQEQGVPPFQQMPEVREDFSNDELQKFVSAATKAQEVQQARQQEMISAIEGEELDVNRFNEIMAVKQGKSQDTSVSEEEMQSFDAAAQKVMEQQRIMQSEIAEAIEDEGITMDTYQQIALAYQQSPKIQKKVTKLLEKEK